MPTLCIALLGCADEPPPPPAAWPLACSPYPGETDPIPDCARRDPDGEIVVRPGALTGTSGPDQVHELIVDGEFHFALASGRAARALPFDNGLDYFVEGRARTVRDGKIGFVDQQLKLVVPRQWDFAFPFDSGFARVCLGCGAEEDDADSHRVIGGGVWGYIDLDGRVVVSVEHPSDSLPPPPAGGVTGSRAGRTPRPRPAAQR